MSIARRAEPWEVSARSETGYVRETNEDRMGAFRVGEGRLYVVADGMGGHNAGALAAELTVKALHDSLAAALTRLPVAEAILAAIRDANSQVYQAAHDGDPGTYRMGSTLVLLFTQGTRAYVAHVGDSRAYLYRDGRLERLTQDHSQVQRLLDTGVLTAPEARTHPLANVIERAIGNEPDVDPTLQGPLEMKRGDGILLCSDGLCGYVDDADVEAVLRSEAGVQDIAERLVGLALGAGGQDNVTVQFVQFGTRRECSAGKVLKGRTENRRSMRPGAVFLAVLAGLVVVVGGVAVFPGIYEEVLGKIPLWRTEWATEKSADVDNLKHRQQLLESGLKALAGRVEANESQIKELERKVVEMKRDVLKSKNQKRTR